MDHPGQRSDTRELDERLSKVILELKNDRVLLKQEITQDLRQEIATMRQESKSTKKNIKTQVVQMFRMKSERQWGALPSKTENNSKERVNAISVKKESLGRKDAMDWLCEGSNPCDVNVKEVEETTSCGFLEKGDEKTTSWGQVFQATETTSCGLESKKKGGITSRDLKAKKNEKRKLLENDEEIEEYACVGKEISALISTGCPIKKGDPGAFVVLCAIKDMEFNKALADLRASINLMSTCVFDELKLPYLNPTRLTLRLADGTIWYPKGIEEDVLVKVSEFVVPVDFVVCDMGNVDSIGPLILGRPFLVMCRAIIDVGTGEITLRFDVNKAKVDMATSAKDGVCNSKQLVKVKIETKPIWEIEKMVLKNT
ncbi:uncharacterized protein LOC116020177 [Ipomoea triloba]|uniref:uncharacterized protein LOC116020177 n=1 Tax=Ipomoea triloba TaxID=35885 RepID=UPI00125E54A7|nr:uncharacterized protein LOC116020177 [Ipomoea triloba]